MHVRVHMTPQIASSCARYMHGTCTVRARIRSLGTRLTHTHARALRFRPSPFCIAHAQIFTMRYLARLRSADASLLPPAWTTSLVLCAVLQECLIHMGNFFAKQPRHQQRRIHEDFATSLVRCVVFVLWFFFELCYCCCRLLLHVRLHFGAIEIDVCVWMHVLLVFLGPRRL